MEFNWKEEIREFIDEKYIMNCEMEKEYSPGWILIQIQTLEKKIWKLECNLNTGIKILNEDDPLKNKIFESFEALLNKISPLYKRKFLMDLNEF
jgi:hypothetical protein